jgi:hypothetical protein
MMIVFVLSLDKLEEDLEGITFEKIRKFSSSQFLNFGKFRGQFSSKNGLKNSDIIIRHN